MLINKGSKIHVIMRRQFQEDVRRHFIGEVLEATDNAVLAEGYVYVFTQGINDFVRKTEKRRRITSLLDSRNVINIIPENVNISKMTYTFDDKQMIVTDGESYVLDIHEFVS